MYHEGKKDQGPERNNSQAGVLAVLCDSTWPWELPGSRFFAL